MTLASLLVSLHIFSLARSFKWLSILFPIVIESRNSQRIAEHCWNTKAHLSCCLDILYYLVRIAGCILILPLNNIDSGL